jgi:ligand-binding sensor domain-containing protein/signal transduction histidine kinase
MRQLSFQINCKFRVFLFFLVLHTISKLVFCQEFDIYFEKLSIRDGLSHSNVYSIIQDKTGYMWFGTQDGLNRYDGITISVFRHDASNPNSITTGNFGKIYQDRSGEYWFGTFGRGIDRYDPKTNTLKNYQFNPDDPSSVSNNQILFIFEDSQGIMWFGTPDGGLNRFNPEDETFARYQHSPSNLKSLSHNRAKSMCETPDGSLWVGTEKGLNKFDWIEGTFKHYYHNPKDENSLSGNIIQNMIANDDGSIWIVTRDGGLNHFDPNNEKFTRYTHDPKNPCSISDNKADCILKDSRNQIWIGTYDGGLNKFDPVSKKFVHFMHNHNDNRSISSNRIECLFEDNSGILWIGTRGGGINKADLKPKKFKNITFNPNIISSIPQHSIMAITSDSKGNIWIGTDGGGLTKLNTNTNSFTHFVSKNNGNSLSNNRVWALLIDRDSVMWIGTYQGGLNRMEFRNGEYYFTHYKNDSKNPKSINHNQINTIIEDSEGNIWIGTPNGLNRLIKNKNPKYSYYQSFQYNPKDSSIFIDNYINSIVEDSKGRLWIGSYQSGLLEFDPETENFNSHLPKGADSINFWKDLRLLTIFEDSHKNLWVGTESNGLVLFDFDNGTQTPHPNNDHLARNMVIAVVEDNHENLWISSTRGLSKYSLIDGLFSTYTISDGLESDGFNRNAAHKSSNGVLYFGSNAALTFFSPEDVINNPHIPEVTLTDFKVLNQSIWNIILAPFVYAQSQVGEVLLTYKDYFFSIHFASFDYTNPSKNYYKYKLEGFNSDWVEVANNTSATFTNLNHGTYTFKVKGSNNDKVWNDTPTELKIRIIPPFWKRTWFYVMEFLLGGVLIFTFIRYRTRKLIRDKRKLEEKVAERTNEINAQKVELEKTLNILQNTQAQLIQSEKMASVGILTAGIAHEINNPLNYIQGGVTALENYFKENRLEQNEEVSQLMEIIGEGVNRTSKIVQSLNRFGRSEDSSSENCDIHAIIDNCLQVLYNQLINKIDVQKRYCQELPKLAGNEGKLHQVFLSILVNAEQAIEKEGKIEISSKIENKFIVIAITDNGCGISKENLTRISDPFFTTKDPGKGTGLGLSIVYSIVKEHKGSIEFESEEGKGTTVKVKLPFAN